MILLKADRLPSAQVAERIGCCMIAVNGWVKRFQADGIEGLKARQGRGRRAILDDQADLAQVRAAVQNHRQKIGLAKAELETSLGKEFSTTTLKRFLSSSVFSAQAFSQKHRCRYKRLRERPKGQPSPDVYALRVECLAELERLSERGCLDLLSSFYFRPSSGFSRGASRCATFRCPASVGWTPSRKSALSSQPVVSMKWTRSSPAMLDASAARRIAAS